jgi:Ras family
LLYCFASAEKNPPPLPPPFPAERFATMHPSYYYRAHACILVFDVTRKPTYKHLEDWYAELRQYCEEIPCCVVANKIDVNTDVVRKSFAFADKHGLPLYFVSAADGTNVVRIFEDAVRAGLAYKRSSDDFMAEVLELLDDKDLGTGSVGDRARAAALLDRRRRELAAPAAPSATADRHHDDEDEE